LVLAAFTPARAQEAPAPEIPSTEATIDKIMEQAVRNIARYYNLNEAQTQETDKLMKREVKRFLKEHEQEVWPLIRALLPAQLNGKPPTDKEEVMRIGKAAQPLAKLAQEAIIQANLEWRQYLTPEQQKRHDADLVEMKVTFEKINRNFEAWAQGSPPEGPIIPAADPPAQAIPRPKMPPPGLPNPIVQHIDVGVFEDIFNKFLADYDDLTAAQIDSARSIMEEFKQKAGDFVAANQAKINELAAKQNAALAKHSKEEVAAVDAERKDLLAPLHELTEQMKGRLHALLDSAQIARREQKSKEQTQAANKTIVRKGTASVKDKPAAPAEPKEPAKPEEKPKPETPSEPTTNESPKPEGNP
jgi:hypothetical protein